MANHVSRAGPCRLPRRARVIKSAHRRRYPPTPPLKEGTKMSGSYYDLGSYQRKVNTSSSAAQTWFDRGLAWCYAYNHDESIRCFERAASLDPECSMAHWGVAYASGCNYNKPWEAFLEVERAAALKRSRAALQRALTTADGAKPVERALVRALAARYPEDGSSAPGDTASLPFQAW